MMMASAILMITDITEVNVKAPFNYGIFDGLLMLINQMLNQVRRIINSKNNYEYRGRSQTRVSASKRVYDEKLK